MYCNFLDYRRKPIYIFFTHYRMQFSITLGVLNMKKVPLLVALATCFLASPVWSDSFTVGVEATDYMPIYKGDGSNYTGYAKELLDGFASKNGHTFTYVRLPVARLFDEFVVKKSLDFKFPDNAYWAKEIKKDAKISYSRGVVSVTEGLMVLPANKGKGNVSRIALVRGFTPFLYMDQIRDKKIAANEVNAPDAGISMAEAGRVDGVYLSVIVANYLMTDVLKKPGVLVFDDKLPNSKSDFSLSSIARPEVIKQFDEYLVKEKDTVDKLKAKYKIVE